MKQPIKLSLRDKEQYIMIYKLKGEHKIVYFDTDKSNVFTLATIVGGKIIV